MASDYGRKGGTAGRPRGSGSMNSIGIIDESQRKAARIAGFAILFGIVIVVVANYGIAFRFLVPNNAVDTARNIMAHETLFRINIVCKSDLRYDSRCTALGALCDPRAGESERCLGRGILQVCICVDVGCERAQLTWRSAALGRRRLPASLRRRSIADVSEAAPLRELRRLLRWPAVLGSGLDDLQLSVVQIEVYPEDIGRLRRDRVCMGRDLCLRVHHFPALRPDG